MGRGRCQNECRRSVLSEGSFQTEPVSGAEIEDVVEEKNAVFCKLQLAWASVEAEESDVADGVMGSPERALLVRCVVKVIEKARDAPGNDALAASQGSKKEDGAVGFVEEYLGEPKCGRLGLGCEIGEVWGLHGFTSSCA